MCRSMVDIQSVAAEIRRGKRKIEEDRKKLQGKNIMAAAINSIIKRFMSQISKMQSAIHSTKYSKNDIFVAEFNIPNNFTKFSFQHIQQTIISLTLYSS